MSGGFTLGCCTAVAQLSDQERVIYAFILPFLDRDGRINAHPTYLKGQVFLGLEYTETQLETAVKHFHDVGLATVYATEDAVVMQYSSFEQFNKPDRREVASEFPDASPELLNRPETRSSVITKSTQGVYGETPRKVRVNSASEVEVEVEGEVEVEVEAEVETQKAQTIPEKPSALPSQNQTATSPTSVKDRNPTFSLIDKKLGYRRGSETDPERVSLLAECLLERPERDAWLELPPNTVRRLITDATEHYRRHGDFKGQLIKLLDRATLEQQKTQKQSSGENEWQRLIAEYEAETGEVYQQ